MSPSKSPTSPALQPRGWTATLVTFGLFGPPIGAMLYLVGVWLVQGASAPASLIPSALSGVSRLPGYWALSYLATPPALLSGLVLAFADPRLSKGLCWAATVASGLGLSWLWYVVLVRTIDLRGIFSWRDSLTFAAMGGGAALICALIVSLMARKAVQPPPAMTQGAA